MDFMPSMMSDFSNRKKGQEQETPKTLGSGFVTSVLGEGGAAVVYEIWNPKLEIHRAVKLWRPNVSEKDLQRFETEIKITSKLDHPNIVEIHTVGEWNGLPFIEMERIDGISLQQILRTNGSLPPVVAIAIMIFISRALIYAHQEEFSLYGRKRKGVIHCDIKPANIMITRHGVVKLMDFGIANPTNVSLHTDPDKVTGSLQYMAPEQIRSHQLDARTDIYSVGVVLYEMLSGTKAFPSKQLLDVIQKRKANDYVPLSQFCVNLPKKFYKLVTTCMELQPEERYQNVTDLMKMLTSLFKRYSHEDPQLIIQQYIETGTIPQHKIHISRQMLVPIIAAVIPSILLLITLAVLMSRTKWSKESQTATLPLKSGTVADRVDTTVSSSGDVRKEVSREEPQQLKKSPEPAPIEVVPPRPKRIARKKVGKKARTAKAIPVPSPPPDQLTILENLVESGNLNAALKRFKAQRINDGAYYSLYARCLYESGEWEKAFEMAEVATRVPSNRISGTKREGRYLLYKAKAHSVRYDRLQTREAAQKAIASWWEVRDHFDGTSESAKASFAESEINRLSTALSK